MKITYGPATYVPPGTAVDEYDLEASAAILGALDAPWAVIWNTWRLLDSNKEGK